MPTRRATQTRAPSDRLLDLNEGGARTGYAPNSLRRMMFGRNDPPPYRKQNGKWVAWLTDLDEWAARRRDGEAS